MQNFSNLASPFGFVWTFGPYNGGTKKYHLSRGKWQWSEAELFCKRNGRELATLNLPGEAEWVIAVANRIFDPANFSSFSVNAKTRIPGAKNGFYWVLEDPLIYPDECLWTPPFLNKLWGPYEPNNLGEKEECVEFKNYGTSSKNNSYLLNDITCENVAHVLCEGL